MDNECAMNRSILLPILVLVCTAAPLVPLLAGDTPAPDDAPPVAESGDGQHDGARRLSPEECKKLREQVRMVSEEGVSAALVPASAPAKEE